MKTRYGVVTLYFVLLLMFPCLPAAAHNLWLNPGNYFPQVGTTVDIGIGWGHTYPADRVDQEVKEDRVQEISAVDPDGLTTALTKVSPALYKLSVNKAGAYLVTAKIKSGNFTMTADGRKWGDKKSVADPIKCTNYHIEAKTVILAGGSDRNLSFPAGQPLEVIPLTHLSNLKNGDKLDVDVLFQGRPLPDATVRATYAGFEIPDIAPHGSSQEGGQKAKKHYPVEAVTDGTGRATVQLKKAGYWMILISHKPPYPDKDTCDEYMYNQAFTFQVR
jgi:nickel transport protein